VPVDPRLVYIDMKTRRAQFHLDALEVVVQDWIDSNPHTVTHYDNFQKAIHIVRIEDEIAPELIPMLVGDFVCCLRAALDQLAWALAHLPPVRTFTEAEERRIQFPIFKIDDDRCRKLLSFFPTAVASELDLLQPYRSGSAYRDNPLWQLNELWNMDKHRSIPVNCTSFNLHFPFHGWERYLHHFTNAVEVHFPLVTFYQSPVNLEPNIAVEVLFGEHMGNFEVSLERLAEINDFVRDDIIPRFAGFFT